MAFACSFLFLIIRVVASSLVARCTDFITAQQSPQHGYIVSRRAAIAVEARAAAQASLAAHRYLGRPLDVESEPVHTTAIDGDGEYRPAGGDGGGWLLRHSSSR